MPAAGDSVKVTTDGTDRDGKPVHGEWTGKFDGKDYPVTGDPTTDQGVPTSGLTTIHLTINQQEGRQITTTVSGADKTVVSGGRQDPHRDT